jgi:hypothetical protein
VATISVNFGKKAKVNQVSGFKVEEEDGALVLRRKKIGYYLGGTLLCVMGLVVGGVALGTLQDIGPRLGLAAFGLLLVAGGVALIRAGMRNNDRIVFDPRAGELRFDMTKEKDRYRIPFGDIDRLELRRHDESTASEERILFQVFVVRKGGDEIKLDEASNAGEMAMLGLHAAGACRAQLVDRATQA